MKIGLKILLSIFFLIAIGFHLPPFTSDFLEKPATHSAYILTYGICWAMIFSGNKNRSLIYAFAATFPFLSHLYYGYVALPNLNQSFWICLVVVIMLVIGFLMINRGREK